MKKRLIIIFLFYSNLSLGQRTTLVSAKEVLSVFETNGIDSALNLFKIIPLYRIDTMVALKLSYSCNSIIRYSRQLNYLTDIGLHIKDKQLNDILFQQLIKYRNSLIEFRSVPLIDYKIVHGIVFQNSSSLIEPLRIEFNFWKSIGDSITKNISDTTNEFSSVKQSFNRCRYNYFLIAWALYKLGASTFTIEYVDLLGYPDSYLTCEQTKLINLNHDGTKWDTLELSNNYTMLNRVDFVKENSIKKRTEYFGIIDKDCKVSLIYNRDSGILNIICCSSEKMCWDAVYELRLVGSNKIAIRWIRGGIS